MKLGAEPIHVAVSVGGSKCAFGAVGLESGTILARSRRVEWTQLGIRTFREYIVMLSDEFMRLLRDNDLDLARVCNVGVAWPGPQVHGFCQATFIPGGDTPHPVSAMLRDEMARSISCHFRSTPVTVILDALARAVGETAPGGAFQFHNEKMQTGVLVNIATGIAGGIVRRNGPLFQCDGVGENYGQFGRFLLLNTSTGRWIWRPTPDGSVAPHSEEEVRWTLRCAGPALARRIGQWSREYSFDGAGLPPDVAQALRYHQDKSARRHPLHEMILLRGVTRAAILEPGGPLAGFLEGVASEIGQALRFLLSNFNDHHIGCVVLAGGVGEHFGRDVDTHVDPFLGTIQRELGTSSYELRRGRLGVDAEFLGLAAVSGELTS